MLGFEKDHHSVQKTTSVHLVAAMLLAVFALQAVLSMRQKSVTTDEITYITAGYYHLQTGDFDYNRTNPPFAKILTALPLLFLEPELPDLLGDPGSWSEVEQWRYARRFLYENRVDADQILFFARLPIVGLALLLGWYIFLWSSQLYGRRSAIVALFLFTFSPNLLAHSRLATQDLALATFGFIAAYYFWKLLEKPGWPNLFKSAVFFALAVITKTSALLLAIPIFIAAAVTLMSGRQILSVDWKFRILDRIQHKRLREFLYIVASASVFSVLTLLAINLTYWFEGSFVPVGTYEQAHEVANAIAARMPALIPLLDGLLNIPLLIPEPMLRMVDFQASRVAGGNSIYFNGQLSRHGWWYVMPAALLIKSPIPLLVLTVVSIASMARQRRLCSGESCLITLAVFILCLFTYLKSISVGIRYVLIIYPCLHVLASGVVRNGIDMTRTRVLMLAVILGWYAFGTLKIYPHYLPYFNEFVGGPKNGYKYLADSFVDWGQDLPGLKKYMEDRGIEKIKLAYFGSADANYYDIKYEYLPSIGLAPTSPEEKWWYEKGAKPESEFDASSGPIAISATLLAGVFYPGYYSALRDIEPVDQIGYSILIFDP